jgi:hypothetical protein
MDLRSKSFSEKASLLGAALNLVTLVTFCIYGAVYNYFDTIVVLTLALGVACSVGYAMLKGVAAEFLNLLAVACVSFGLGLFFLNSYPVWADRLNNISMYGSRGTLVPVIAIMVLCFLVVLADIISCFTRKERVE